LFCHECGQKILLPKLRDTAAPADTTEIDRETKVADNRTDYETAVARLKSIVHDREKAPSCFISYAWGNVNHEQWVLTLATDLRNAGVDVLFDKWKLLPGYSLLRFVGEIKESDFIAVIGTPLYKQKYDNSSTDKGTIVAAEMDVIGARLMGTEGQKCTVLPLLREGEVHNSFPPFFPSRVCEDFRRDEVYFSKLFDLLRALYRISPDDPALSDVDEWRRAADLLARAR